MLSHVRCLLTTRFAAGFVPRVGCRVYGGPFIYSGVVSHTSLRFPARSALGTARAGTRAERHARHARPALSVCPGAVRMPALAVHTAQRALRVVGDRHSGGVAHVLIQRCPIFFRCFASSNSPCRLNSERRPFGHAHWGHVRFMAVAGMV